MAYNRCADAAAMDVDKPELAKHYQRDSAPQNSVGLVVIEKAKISPGQKGIDIGAGVGYLARIAAKEVGPDGHVTAVDRVQRTLIAGTEALENLSSVVGDAHYLSKLFADGSLDFAYSNCVWHWLWDRILATRQTHDVLKPQSRFVFSSGSSEHPFELPGLIREVISQEAFKDYPGAAKVTKFSTYEEITNLAKETGFHAEEINPYYSLIKRSNARYMFDFFNASSSNIFGALPDHLQHLAEEALIKKISALSKNGSIEIELTVWICVFIKK
jgi:ubiquinone/menaquinone biosynthesis C-methylase UbiE